MNCKNKQKLKKHVLVSYEADKALSCWVKHLLLWQRSWGDAGGGGRGGRGGKGREWDVFWVSEEGWGEDVLRAEIVRGWQGKGRVREDWCKGVWAAGWGTRSVRVRKGGTRKRMMSGCAGDRMNRVRNGRDLLNGEGYRQRRVGDRVSDEG